MTELYLIRHTQAEGNLYRCMQGHWDGEVTALGLREIELLAERFRDVSVDRLYSSDLKRAMLTAGAIQKYHDLPLETVKELREINIGPWETKFFADLLYAEREKMERFMYDSEHFSLEGAETYGQVRERAARALTKIAEENEGKTVVIVSHGVTIRCLLSYILQKELGDRALPICGNTGINHIFYENGSFRVESTNDCSHLDVLQLPHWSRSPDIRSEPIDPLQESDYYAACYADAWKAAHGSLEGYNGEIYLSDATQHHRADGESVLKFYDGETAVGLLDLDPLRGLGAGYGWISLLYLREDYRRRGCGVQLLGRAILHYRALGRRAVRLCVAEDNRAALHFYEKHGFRKLSSEQGRFGKLYIMEFRFGGSYV